MSTVTERLVIAGELTGNVIQLEGYDRIEPTPGRCGVRRVRPNRNSIKRNKRKGEVICAQCERKDSGVIRI